VRACVFLFCLCAPLQWQPTGGDGGAPVAIKVLDCSEDDASCFERVYSEVRLTAMQCHAGCWAAALRWRLQSH
jgi:hypothetical protein